jgi:hypothetical protein
MVFFPPTFEIKEVDLLVPDELHFCNREIVGSHCFDRRIGGALSDGSTTTPRAAANKPT